MNLVVGVTLYSQPNYYHKILAIDYNWQLANIKNTVCKTSQATVTSRQVVNGLNKQDRCQI